MRHQRPGTTRGALARARRAALALLAILVTSGVAAKAQAPTVDAYLRVPVGGGPIDAGPVPAGIDAIDAASCGECHERHYREWRRSTHHTSFTNEIFLAEFGHRRSPFCANCHAPRGDEAAGVDCAVCHVRDGMVLNPTVSGRAPHASRETAELAGSLACARCHEFEFRRQPGELLQRTVTEWMSSAHHDTSCQGCHLRARGSHHAHDFPGGRDRRLLRDAIRVNAHASVVGDATHLVLELSADAAGHAVPTGDMFRVLVVRAWPLGHPERRATTTLARRFRVDERGWHEVEDQRVPASGARTVELEIEGTARSVAYTIDLWRTPPRRARQLGWPPGDVRSRIAAGRVSVSRGSSSPEP